MCLVIYRTAAYSPSGDSASFVTSFHRYTSLKASSCIDSETQIQQFAKAWVERSHTLEFCPHQTKPQDLPNHIGLLAKVIHHVFRQPLKRHLLKCARQHFRRRECRQWEWWWRRRMRKIVNAWTHWGGGERSECIEWEHARPEDAFAFLGICAFQASLILLGMIQALQRK